MKFHARLGLKLGLPVFGFLALLSLLFFWLFRGFEARLIRQSLEGRLIEAGDFFYLSVANNASPSAMDFSVHSIGAFDHMKNIYVFAEAKDRVAVSNRNENKGKRLDELDAVWAFDLMNSWADSEIKPQVEYKDGISYMIYPFLVNDVTSSRQVRYDLVVEPDLGQFDVLFGKDLTSFLWLSLGFLCVSMAFFLFWVNRNMVAPLQAFSSHIGEFQDRIFKPFIYHGHDELGHLIHEYNSVMAHLQETRLELQQALQGKSEFLASMSHEIRTPMNGVLGMLDLLSDTPLNSDQFHKLSLAKSSAKALLHLINEVLDFSKIEAGKLEFEELVFDLPELLGEVAESLAPKAHQKGLELLLDISQITGNRVVGDPSRIRQILNNLIGNALKFTERGEIKVVGCVTQQGSDLVFSCQVHDSGPGFEPSKGAHLFETFKQLDSSTTRKYGGTGLGLAISKKLCQGMGGDIEAESEVGCGATFTFWVQVKPSSAWVSAEQSWFKGLLVSVLDDHEGSVSILEKQLQSWGITTKPYFELDRSNDLLLADLGALNKRMEWVRSRIGLAKVIVMTNMETRKTPSFFQEQGFGGFFVKPATREDLIRALKTTQGETGSYWATSQHAEGGMLSKKGRILLVEDNMVNQRVAQGLLHRLALTVQCASNGLEALGCLCDLQDETPYDLILMDCQMPEMDGFEASRRIRKGLAGSFYQDIPIIALTANALQGDREKCLAHGMDDYLPKPLDPQKLTHVLEKWL